MRLFKLLPTITNYVGEVIDNFTQSIQNPFKEVNIMQPDLTRTAFELILSEEGYKSKPYYCTEGFPTIGIGFRIGNKGEPLPIDRTMSLEEAKRLCYQKIELAINNIQIDHPLAWNNCNTERKSILISMYFQLGRVGLSNFKQMIAAINSCSWILASEQAKDSRWYRQTPKRAYRHAQTLLEGNFAEYTKQGYTPVKIYYK